MMIVDTTVWADYFNGVESRHSGRMDRALAEEEDVAILPLSVSSPSVESSRIDFTWSQVKLGFSERIKAAAPVTKAVAMDVPLMMT